MSAGEVIIERGCTRRKGVCWDYECAKHLWSLFSIHSSMCASVIVVLWGLTRPRAWLKMRSMFADVARAPRIERAIPLSLG